MSDVETEMDRDIATVGPVEEVLDLLTDEDGELVVGEALTTLLAAVAAVCGLTEEQSPTELAAEFGTKLLQAVARQHVQDQMVRRLLS